MEARNIYIFKRHKRDSDCDSMALVGNVLNGIIDWGRLRGIEMPVSSPFEKFEIDGRDSINFVAEKIVENTRAIDDEGVRYRKYRWYVSKGSQEFTCMFQFFEEENCFVLGHLYVNVVSDRDKEDMRKKSAKDMLIEWEQLGYIDEWTVNWES